MEAYQIMSKDRNPQTLDEERRNPQLESQRSNLNERVLNMVRVMSHDLRGSLVSMSATLKLLSRGYYGKMDEGVANNLKDLLSKTISLIGITEEYLGRTFSLNNDLETVCETLDLGQDIINPVLKELATEIKDRQILIDMTRLPYVDSTELGRLIRCHLAVRQAGGRVRLCCLSDRMMTLVRVMRLDTVFDIYPSVGEAIAAIHS